MFRDWLGSESFLTSCADKNAINKIRFTFNRKCTTSISSVYFLFVVYTTCTRITAWNSMGPFAWVFATEQVIFFRIRQNSSNIRYHPLVLSLYIQHFEPHIPLGVTCQKYSCNHIEPSNQRLVASLLPKSTFEIATVYRYGCVEGPPHVFFNIMLSHRDDIGLLLSHT